MEGKAGGLGDQKFVQIEYAPRVQAILPRINEYRRRAIFSDAFNLSQTAESDSLKNKEKEGETDKYGVRSESLTPKVSQKENNFIRGVREEQEMCDFLNGYKKSKVNFYRNMTKNYYKN